MSDSLRPVDHSTPGSSVDGVLQVRILEWVAMLSSRESSHPGIELASLPSPALTGKFFISSTSWYILTHLILNQAYLIGTIMILIIMMKNIEMQRSLIKFMRLTVVRDSQDRYADNQFIASVYINIT